MSTSHNSLEQKEKQGTDQIKKAYDACYQFYLAVTEFCKQSDQYRKFLSELSSDLPEERRAVFNQFIEAYSKISNPFNAEYLPYEEMPAADPKEKLKNIFNATMVVLSSQTFRNNVIAHKYCEAIFPKLEIGKLDVDKAWGKILKEKTKGKAKEKEKEKEEANVKLSDVLSKPAEILFAFDQLLVKIEAYTRDMGGVIDTRSRDSFNKYMHKLTNIIEEYGEIGGGDEKRISTLISLLSILKVKKNELDRRVNKNAEVVDKIKKLEVWILKISKQIEGAIVLQGQYSTTTENVSDLIDDILKDKVITEKTGMSYGGSESSVVGKIKKIKEDYIKENEKNKTTREDPEGIDLSSIDISQLRTGISIPFSHPQNSVTEVPEIKETLVITKSAVVEDQIAQQLKVKSDAFDELEKSYQLALSENERLKQQLEGMQLLQGENEKLKQQLEGMQLLRGENENLKQQLDKVSQDKEKEMQGTPSISNLDSAHTQQQISQLQQDLAVANEKIDRLTKLAGFRGHLIAKLDEYLNRIRKYPETNQNDSEKGAKPNFFYDFYHHEKSRGWNRKANFCLAELLKEKLSDPKNAIEDVFANVNKDRDELIHKLGIDKEKGYVRRAIHSNELNAIIGMAKEEIHNNRKKLKK